MSKGSRGPSMHDVAARAGVSHQTVSRVLNGFEGIRPETRERVLQAIEALGYRRNLAARALVTGRTHTIGMIGPVVPDIGPLSTLHAIERSARAVGLHTMMTSTEPTAGAVCEAVEFLMGRGIDALAVAAQQTEVEQTVTALQTGIPEVFLLTGGSPQGASVSIDQRAGMRRALNHLLEHGHTRIQHLSGPELLTEARIRRDEYRAVMTAAGLPPLPLLRGDWSADAGYRAAWEVDADATAVMCANDHMAIGLLHGLHERGICVPADISVVGFDDIAESRHCVPPLTTVRQDFAAVGQAAVQWLCARMGATAEPSATTLLPELVIRDTTGPVPV